MVEELYDDDHHSRDVQGRREPEDEARHRYDVAAGLDETGDGDECEDDRPARELDDLLVERELPRRRTGLAKIDAQQLRVAAAKRWRKLIREAEEMATPLAARDQQRSIAGHDEVRHERRDGEEDDAGADVMDAVEEVQRDRQIHVEDAAEVLPHSRGQREHEAEREDPVAEHRAGTPAPDRSVGADLRAVRPRHEHADGDAKAEYEWQHLDEYEVVGELVAPGLRVRAGLTERRRHANAGEHQARDDDEPGHDPHVLSRSPVTPCPVPDCPRRSGTRAACSTSPWSTRARKGRVARDRSG